MSSQANRTIKIIRWDKCPDDMPEAMWVEQQGYEGAWIPETDRRYQRLQPILDLMAPDNREDGMALPWDEFNVYHLTMAEWDSITEGALVP